MVTERINGSENNGDKRAQLETELEKANQEIIYKKGRYNLSPELGLSKADLDKLISEIAELVGEKQRIEEILKDLK